MYGIILTAASSLALFAYFIIYPIVYYFYDPKGLRKYPNLNPLSGITDLAFIWESNKGFRSAALLEAHKKHPVIRIGPNSLSYSTVPAIKDIYGHNTSCTKDLFYDALAGTHYHLADVTSKSEHQRKRRVLSSAYALKNLEGWEHKVSDKTERLIKAFDARCTAPLAKGITRPKPEDLTIDYRAWTNFFTLDAIADIGLSERLGFLDQGHDLCVAERLDGTTYKAHYRNALHSTAKAQAGTVWCYEWYPFLARVSNWVSPTYRKWWTANVEWNDIVYHRATQRLARYRKGEKLADFFQALMEDKSGAANGLEWGELVAEVSIMMNAGSDTTAIAMVRVMLNLLGNPRCWAKLQEEIDAALEKDDVVAPYDKVKHLPYLRACLDESLRLTPPTTFGLPRRTPAEGTSIAGTFVPGNTSVSISAWVAHRDPTLYPRPEEYIPERWLEVADRPAHLNISDFPAPRELQAGFIAFSTGARGCIGRNISYLEQTVLLASVVHRYELALQAKGWEPEVWEAMNLMPGAVPVKVWRRETSLKEIEEE
jgi:cytochrome P450